MTLARRVHKTHIMALSLNQSFTVILREKLKSISRYPPPPSTAASAGTGLAYPPLVNPGSATALAFAFVISSPVPPK